MHIELRHLRAIRAIEEEGGLSRAALRLGLTQSALSHQMKALEDQAGQPLFLRRSKPLRLSPAGTRFLRAAEVILPEIAALAEDLSALKGGRAGRLHIALECHACFDWLFPVLTHFRRAWPAVDVDIRAGLAFEALGALAREEVDFVLTSNPEPLPGLSYQPLFDYHPTFVAAASHALAAKARIEPQDFAGEVLITYPVPRDKLDVFTDFLGPAGVEPRGQRQADLTDVILMLVAAGRGVAVLPDWVLRRAGQKADYALRPLGDGRRTRRLYAAVREEALSQPFIAHALRLCRSEPVKLQREGLAPTL